MIIKNIRIKRFGALKDKEIELKEGINIVSGDNEAGKTTLQYFIKSFLYGMSTKRSKTIRDNIRSKYALFNGERASGEVQIHDEEKDILIIRSFGSTKKEDTVKVLDGLTGKEISDLNHEEPAKTLLNINSSSFENTLFIKGLGTYLNSSKDDEIMHKLTNSLESGEEGVSYFKAIGKLETIRKALTTARGNGKLDVFREKKISILEEREDFLKASEKNLEDEMKIINLKDEISSLRIRLKKLEIYKKHLRKIKLQKEYKDILQYLKKSEELKNQAKLLEGELIWEDGIIDRERIEGLKEESAVILSFYNLREGKSEEGKEIEKEKLEIEEKIYEFGTLIELGEDLEDKLLKISRETEKSKGKLMVYEENKSELQELRRRLENIKYTLGNVVNIENFEDQIDILLREYEDKLFQLKSRLLDRRVINSYEEFKSKSFLKNIYNTTIVLGILVSFLLVSIKPVLSVITLLVSGVFLILNFNNSKKLDILKMQNKEEEVIKDLEKSIKEKEIKLMDYGKSLNLNSYEEFGRALSEYKKYKEEIKTLMRMIEERENKLKVYDIKEINKLQEDNDKILKSVLTYTESENLDELLNKIKSFKIIKSRQEIIFHKWETYIQGYNSLKEDIERRESILRRKLRILKLENISFYDLPKELDKLIEKLKEKDEILSALNGVNETYKALLKDRDLEHMKEELQEMLSDSLEYSYEDEEEIERDIKLSQNKLLETEKDLKDVENSVSNRFLGKRSLIVIEGDFQEISDKIISYEKELEALELAKELLEESFKELQKNIGPILNEKVSYYFNKLTIGKYSEVKVGDEYELLVRDTNGEVIKGDYLSNGTWDQVYLSLRLALVDMLFGDSCVPLIFDDAFVQYDDKRLESTLEVIKELSDKRQIILFSCQRREVELLKDFANVISL